MTDSALAILLFGSLAGLAAFAGLRDLLGSAPELVEWLRRALEPLLRAGREGYLPSRPEARRLAVALTALGAAAGWALFGAVVAGLLCLATPLASRRLLVMRRVRYRRRLDASLPDAACAIADSLVAGRSLRTALAELAPALDGVAAAEFAALGTELEFGASTRAVIGELRRRHATPRVESFCAVLLAGSDSGADLAELLRRFADAARAKDRADRDARSATAQARFTGILVASMPAGAAFFAELMHGGLLLSVLRSPPATALVAVAIAMQICGFLLIRRLARTR